MSTHVILVNKNAGEKHVSNKMEGEKWKKDENCENAAKIGKNS